MGMLRYCEKQSKFEVCCGDCDRCGVTDVECRVVIGGVYHHFKGSLYVVRAVGTHTETGEKLVVYTKLPDEAEVWIRPYSMFVSEVDHAKYPECTQKYRFKLLKG